MEIKFNSDDHKPLNISIWKIHDKIIALRSVFNDGKKYYPQGF